MNIQLVAVWELAQGDRILLDSGAVVEVKSTELGKHRDQMIIRLRRAQPLYVNGYCERFIRRTYQAPKVSLPVRCQTHWQAPETRLPALLDT